MARFPKRSGGTAAFDAIKPDPDRVGGVAEAPFVRLPHPASVFATRAERLAALGPGHPLEAYLRFLSLIVSAQHAAQAALPPPRPPDADQVAQRVRHTMPALSADLLRDDPSFGETLNWLLANVAVKEAPAEARAARERLAARDAAGRLTLAADVFEAAYPADRLGETLYVAAAVQTYFTRQAAMLDPARLQAVADGVCPVCGGAPVASLVVGWTQASKARYLCCSLCSALWNYVRIKCACCGSTEGISYHTVEGGSPNVAAETCGACRSYLKHLHQHEDPSLEPFADDVASYGLDVLLREEEWRRGGVNPLFVVG